MNYALPRVASRVALAFIAASFAGITACSSAPESEPVEVGAQALPRQCQALSGCGSDPPVCAYPTETLWYPYVTTLPIKCSDASILSAPRAFDTSVPFEVQLQAAGCTNSVRKLAGGYSIATCPDTCAVRKVAATYANTQPILSQVTHKSPGTCFAAPAAGTVYLAWDPKCPNLCTPVLDDGP